MRTHRRHWTANFRAVRRAGYLLDTAAIAIFVGIGRSVHEHGGGFPGFCSTAWPFLVAAGFGWAAARARHLPVTAIAAGGIVVVVTTALGMALRLVSGQGSAVAFVLVTLGFLGATMGGWRVLYRWSPPRPSRQVARAVGDR